MPETNNQPVQPQEGVATPEIVRQCENGCGRDTGSRWMQHCDTCYDELYADCERCGEDVNREYLDERGVCESCRDGEDEDDRYGDWASRRYFTGNSAQYQSNRPGKFVQSTRIFSAELECYAPSRKDYNEVLAKIPEGIGASGDGSLGDNGREFQTPKLKGAQGEKVLTDLCKTLNDNDFTVNSSCGLHIHLDGRGLFPRTKSTAEPVALKQVWAFYHVYEPVIHSFLPSARRSNTYCHSITRNVGIMSIIMAKSLRAIESLWYTESHPGQIDRRKDHKYDDTRYNGVNLHSLLGSKHLEIRYHSGTLNSIKILQWVNLHLAVLDRAANKDLNSMDTLDVHTKYTNMCVGGNKDGALDMLTMSLFERLNLNDAARAYFLKCQAQFTGRKGETANDESLCVA